MQKANHNNMPRLRLIAIAASAVVISACGGGSGGGGFPVMPALGAAPQPAPASDPVQTVVDSSAPCFNEADFREGTVVDVQALKTESSPESSSFRRVSVTGGREAFAGANPVAFKVDLKKSDVLQGLGNPLYQEASEYKEYKDLVDGSFLLYGNSKTSKYTLDPKHAASVAPGAETDIVAFDSQAFSPAFSFPVDMTPGQVVSQQSTVVKTSSTNGRSSPSTSLPATGEFTYHGREQLETPMGTFNTCKFSLKLTIAVSKFTKERSNVFWVASEGPYRGQTLKGTDSRSPMFVTKMSYSPK